MGKKKTVVSDDGINTGSISSWFERREVNGRCRLSKCLDNLDGTSCSLRIKV